MKRFMIFAALIPVVIGMSACTPKTSAGSKDATLTAAACSTADPGKTIFGSKCVICHEQDGSKPADWKSKVKAMSDTQVRKWIKSGGGKGMPPFSGTLTDTQIGQVAAYAEKLAKS